MNNSPSFKRNIYGWLLTGPFVISLGIFFLYALIRTLFFSFTQYDLFSNAVWVGLRNFVDLFSDRLFLIALANTLGFSITVTLIQTVLALGLAILVNSKILARGFFRTAFYLPSIMSSAAVTLIFIWFYQKNGYLNHLISSIVHVFPEWLFVAAATIVVQGILVMQDRLRGYPAHPFEPAWLLLALLIAGLLLLAVKTVGWFPVSPAVPLAIEWMNTQQQIGPLPLTLWAVALQNIYTTIPTFMLLFLAGLQGIPGELYEAARIDGANKWQQHWHITLPQLAPVTFVVITFSIIGTLQMFDQVALLGAAAPLESRITLAYYVYHNTFPPGGTPAVGMASAASLVLAAITLMVVYLQKTFGVREKNHG